LQETENPNAHIQFATIGTIKSLIAGGETMLQKFATSGGVQPLIAIARGEVMSKEQQYAAKENPQERDKRVEYEAARVLARISTNGDNRKTIAEGGGIEPLLELIKSSYEILQHEGIKAILELASTGTYINQLIAAGTSEVITNYTTNNPQVSEMQKKISILLIEGTKSEPSLV